MLSTRNIIQGSYATSHVSSAKPKVQEMHKNLPKGKKSDCKSRLSPGVISLSFSQNTFKDLFWYADDKN